MNRYRGKKQHRQAHPKIVIWSHTQKAEIEYFRDYQNYLKTPLLISKKRKVGTPTELISYVIAWKEEKIIKEDNDQVWCVFDVDDFYMNDGVRLLRAIKSAKKHNIKIAYANECFELWILLHFMKVTSQIQRGKDIEEKINIAFKKNKLKKFKKNQKIFNILLPFQKQAIDNSQSLLKTKYYNINWNKMISDRGNPSTSIHFLIEEIKNTFTKY